MTKTNDTKISAKDKVETNVHNDPNAKDIVNGQIVDRDVSKSTNPRYNKGAWDSIEDYVANLTDEEVRMEVNRLTSGKNIKEVSKKADELQDPEKNRKYLLELKKDELRG